MFEEMGTNKPIPLSTITLLNRINALEDVVDSEQSLNINPNVYPLD